ncbi:MAG TPA: hypothetical protein VIX91_08520 [Candidatus Acidoferrum sp.]
MAKTAVGLFENAGRAEEAVREIEALGVPRNEVRTLAEPKTFEITGVMSFPRLDFEVQLRRELARIGATKTEIETYIDGLRRGGALVFATGAEDDAKVDAAADAMNRLGAKALEEATGPEPQLPHAVRGVMSPAENPVLTGRVRQRPDGASVFVR